MEYIDLTPHPSARSIFGNRLLRLLEDADVSTVDEARQVMDEFVQTEEGSLLLDFVRVMERSALSPGLVVLND